jgi:hypothetical protein
VEELFSLFQFLRARPLDDWQLFRERILAPVKEGRTKLAMKRLHVSQAYESGGIDADIAYGSPGGLESSHAEEN